MTVPLTIDDMSRRGRKEEYSKQRRFPVEMAADMELGDAPEWLIKGLLPARGLAAVYGAPSCGKSFLALDAALHIALGWDWFERKVMPGGVIYIAAEAGKGMRKRVIAFLREHGVTGHVPLGVIPVAPDLGSKDGDAETLIADIKAQVGMLGAPLREIVVDTMARTMGSADENTAAGMGAYITNAARIADTFSCLTLLVHHSGKDAERGMRGSTALHAACDAEWRIEATGDIREVNLAKQKEGEDNLHWMFRLRQIELGRDEDNFPITSCVVAPETSPKHGENVSAKRKPTGQNALVLNAIARAIDELPGIPPASNHIPRNVPVTSRESARKMAERLGFGDADKPDALRAAFSRCVLKLTGDRFIGTWNDGPDGKGTQWLWLL